MLWSLKGQKKKPMKEEKGNKPKILVVDDEEQIPYIKSLLSGDHY